MGVKIAQASIPQFLEIEIVQYKYMSICVNLHEKNVFFHHIISTAFNYPSCHDIDHGNHKCMAIHYIIPNAVHFTEDKLDELTARRHLKSPWSLSGRSLHFILVTKRSPSLVMNEPLLFNVNWFSYSWDMAVSNLNLEIQGQGHGQGQTAYSMFAFRFVAIDHFWLRYSKFHIWPWKFKVKVMARSIPRAHSGPRVQSICLLFVSWQSDHFWLR